MYQQSSPSMPKFNINLKSIFIGVLLVVLVVCSLSCFYTVDTGERGVVLRFGSLESVAGEGLNFKIPYVDNVKIMSIRDKNLTITTEVSSSDIQTIRVDVALVYSLEAEQVGKIFQTYGLDIENTLIRPTLSEKVNAVIAEYPIETFVEKRAEISNKINTTFSEQVAGTGIKVKSLLITNHDFSDDFNKAIEDKKIAEQGALTAKFTLERMKLEAEAQKVKQASLSPLVLQEMAINKWNGQLPQYFSGDQLPFLTIK
jgi:regulator of protease activity HflC (stomatin/prohibitin superfamily)